MNLYLRYFDKETLVYNVDDAIDFLASIDEIGMNNELERDIRDYVSSDVFYPKRYKIRPRVYFIIIKTEAATMLDFKQKKALRSNVVTGGQQDMLSSSSNRVFDASGGGDDGGLDCNRVGLVPVTGKHVFWDTHFVVNCKAMSGIDCYNRMVEYLRGRVDSRSQFPSAKGKNFKFKYLGLWK